jgi:hypothetical protein
MHCGGGGPRAGTTGKARAEPDDPCAESRFRLSEKRTSPFESAGVSVQSAVEGCVKF